MLSCLVLVEEENFSYCFSVCSSVVHIIFLFSDCGPIQANAIGNFEGFWFCFKIEWKWYSFESDRIQVHLTTFIFVLFGNLGALLGSWWF